MPPGPKKPRWLSSVLATVGEASRLGPIRRVLIESHDAAARRLGDLAAIHELKAAQALLAPSWESQATRTRRSRDHLRRARSYRKLGWWYAWQGLRCRLPLLVDTSPYRGLEPREADLREFIKLLGRLERIEFEINPPPP